MRAAQHAKAADDLLGNLGDMTPKEMERRLSQLHPTGQLCTMSRRHPFHSHPGRWERVKRAAQQSRRR